MQRTLLRSKLHRVTCTHAELDYEGSIAIDGRLLDAADIREYERVDVYNRMNVYFIYYKVEGDLVNGTLKTTPVKVSLFPVIPSFTWNFKF